MQSPSHNQEMHCSPQLVIKLSKKEDSRVTSSACASVCMEKATLLFQELRDHLSHWSLAETLFSKGWQYARLHYHFVRLTVAPLVYPDLLENGQNVHSYETLVGKFFVFWKHADNSRTPSTSETSNNGFKTTDMVNCLKKNKLWNNVL